MAIEKSEHFWAKFGKVSAVLSTLAVAIGIFASVRPGGPSLVCNCSYWDYYLPPDLQSHYLEMRQQSSEDAMFKKAAASLKLSDNISSGIAKQIVSVLSDYLEKTGSRAYYLSTRYEGFAELKTYNKGSKPAENVTIDLPYKGVAQIVPGEANDPQRGFVEVNREIKLGTIRPKNSATVRLWITSPMWSSEKKNVRISHSGGTGKVRFSVLLSGFFGNVVGNYTLMFAVIAFATVMLFFDLAEFIRKTYNVVSGRSHGQDRKE